MEPDPVTGEIVAALFTGVPAVAGLTEAQRRQLHDLLTKVTASQGTIPTEWLAGGLPEP